MIKTIVLGTTGMVGEGVLHKCLESPEVESVLVINRRPCGVQHQKLKEIIQDMIKKHLGWLVVWGGVFGGLIGLIAAVLQ